MRSEIIARNYAETLLELARRQGPGAVEEYAGAMQLLADATSGARVREFLSTPRVSAPERKDALRKALQGKVPELFLRFVMVVVDKRRQALLPDIAHEYRRLVDEQMGRVRVDVHISHEPDAALQEQIARALAGRLGKTVIPSFTVDPSLLGGMVVRYGEEILDGSVRSRAAGLRRRLTEVANG
ncbi:ATP synthase F1 subunit delta [Longimicrobium sp.]|uniref:ATP synthase F1 subunit delta n=1 Tax=Longimicrobium sp. TaxID=2029185 RepID=UPI002C4902C7|nr:ATP synthase F1 subunit delta [Longimicrobium sp.]HSU16470.1 ATP synthase F1 subunit delta [Longimicrobium sp.]